MAKQIYKVPTPLEMSYLDVEIALQDDSGAGLRPIPIKTILIWIGSMMGLLLILLHSYIRAAGPVWMVLFALLWIFGTYFYGKADESGRIGASLVPVLLRYLPKSARKLTTRAGDNAFDFMTLTGLSEKGIDKRNTIYWADGSVGVGFRIVGTASILLFDEDRRAILDRVNNFYMKLDTDTEVIFDTTKESQKVENQLRYTRLQFANREVKDVPGLNKLYRERYDVLHDYVGERFPSIHQYMFVKSQNYEALERFMAMFYQETTNSSRMFKKATLMTADDIYEYFGGLLGVKKSS